TEETNDAVAAPRRYEHGDVEQLARGLVRIVRDEDVARFDRVQRVLLEHLPARDGKRVDVTGRARNRLRDHPAATVEQRVREVARLAHDGAERRALQRLRLLVDRADQALPEHLERDRVHPYRPLTAITDPSSFTVAVQPGLNTAVVSRSSSSAGPLTCAPTPSASRSYTGVATGSALRVNRTGLVPFGVALALVPRAASDTFGAGPN